MKKATFESAEPTRKPTHWRHRDTGSISWKIGTFWNRISKEGRVTDRHTISINPENNPQEYLPLYGDLIITISEN